jgi:diguanylate cyclase
LKRAGDGAVCQLNSHYVEKETLVDQLRAANVALEMHSYTDELTGLANRRALFKHLSSMFPREREQQRNLLLIFIDLDDFKAINDRFGHQCGDSFLIQIGERLKAHIRPGDLVGRLGGDEFLVVGTGWTRCSNSPLLRPCVRPCVGFTFLANTGLTIPAPVLASLR